MKKKVPKLKTDRQAENFVAASDLTQYDLSEMQIVQFEFARKAARINMRLPEDLLKAVKTTAARRGMPYQRFIRQTLEHAVTEARPPKKAKG